MKEGTTSYSTIYRPEPRVVQVGRHLVVHSAIEDYIPINPATILVFDPPAVDDSWSCQQYEDWFGGQVLPVLNTACAKDAALILIPRDRKGGGWLKSVATAALIQKSGWQLFRHFIWERQEAEFNRSKYAFGSIFTFRRGSRPSNDDSPIRYKDIIRLKDSREEGLIGAFPVDLVKLMLTLFLRPGDIVMDPFAGSGSVAVACEELGIPSISVELDKGRFNGIVDRLQRYIDRT